MQAVAKVLILVSVLCLSGSSEPAFGASEINTAFEAHWYQPSVPIGELHIKSPKPETLEVTGGDTQIRFVNASYQVSSGEILLKPTHIEIPNLWARLVPEKASVRTKAKLFGQTTNVQVAVNGVALSLAANSPVILRLPKVLYFRLLTDRGTSTLVLEKPEVFRAALKEAIETFLSETTFPTLFKVNIVQPDGKPLVSFPFEADVQKAIDGGKPQLAKYLKELLGSEKILEEITGKVAERVRTLLPGLNLSEKRDWSLALEQVDGKGWRLYVQDQPPLVPAGGEVGRPDNSTTLTVSHSLLTSALREYLEKENVTTVPEAKQALLVATIHSYEPRVSEFKRPEFSIATDGDLAPKVRLYRKSGKQLLDLKVALAVREANSPNHGLNVGVIVRFELGATGELTVLEMVSAAPGAQPAQDAKDTLKNMLGSKLSALVAKSVFGNIETLVKNAKEAKGSPRLTGFRLIGDNEAGAGALAIDLQW